MLKNDYAIRMGYSLWPFSKYVKYLVNQGANVMSEDDCAIKWAAENGHLEMVKYLVSQELANISAEDRFCTIDGLLKMAI